MRTNIEEALMVALFLSSLRSHSKYVPIIASINTLLEDVLTWSYVTSIVIEEYKRLK